MSKIVKGVRRAVGKVFKTVKKTFKAITKSTIGKVALAAAAIYFGGVALGQWGGAGSTAAGAGSGVAGATEAATLAGTTGTTAATTTAATTAGAGAAGAGAAGASAASAGAGLGGAAGGVATEVAKKGIISSFLGNPVVQMAAAGGISSAFSPDAMDIEREREKAENRRRQMAYGGIENINIGITPTGQGGVGVQQPGINSKAPMKDELGNEIYNPYSSGVRSGIIARNMQRNKNLMGAL